MKGLEIAKKYYETFAKEQLNKQFSGIPFAAGLVGEGSQCFGYDDEISRDHDFAPGFCIWLSDDVFRAYGSDLERFYQSLPSSFMGVSTDNIVAPERLGVMRTGEFYSRFTGRMGRPDFPGLPQTNIEWLFAAEAPLAAAVNGEVFRDTDGKFTAVRKKLLDFYPEDILRKKLAARAAVLAQAGQYNLFRCLKRQDEVAAMFAVSRFCEAAISMSHLLNRKYKPFYKWAYRSLTELPKLKECNVLIGRLPQVTAEIGKDRSRREKEVYDMIETICSEFVKELNLQGFSAQKNPWLQAHLSDIMSGIKDPQIAAMAPIADCPNE